PPMPTMNGGKPLANVVTVPVVGSTRDTLPTAPSVTNSAPPGPIVLPDPLAKPLTRSVAVGAASGTGPFADNGVIAAISAAVAKRVSVLFVIICRLLCVSTYLCRGRQHTACRAKNTSEAVLLSILGA